MRKVTFILFSLFLILAASGRIFAQQRSSASQVVSFGVIRSSAAVAKVLSSTQNQANLYGQLENVPAKITVSPNVAPSNHSGKILARFTSTTAHSQVPTLHLPSLNDAQSQMDLRVLMAEQRPPHFGSSPLIVTITD